MQLISIVYNDGKIPLPVIVQLYADIIGLIHTKAYFHVSGVPDGIGNGVFSIAYLLTMNPLAAILPHIAMHITAMIHGRETTGQAPPHYADQAINL